ncbi:MAG: CBS domain-containing protein, partial [Zetaproteobacteria bacterium]|nr:CBS domain-containing protein [Zetaproteobacteria bacterium]
MTRNVVTVDINADLSDACLLFLTHKIRHLPVVKDDSMVGLLSYNDVLRLSFGESYDDKSEIDDTVFKLLQVEQIMVTDPIKIHANCSIRKAAKIMINNK